MQAETQKDCDCGELWRMMWRAVVHIIFPHFLPFFLLHSLGRVRLITDNSNKYFICCYCLGLIVLTLAKFSMNLQFTVNASSLRFFLEEKATKKNLALIRRKSELKEWIQLRPFFLAHFFSLTRPQIK